MKIRQTEVTIETDEVWIIRQPVGSGSAWCSICGERTTHIKPDEAALLTGSDSSEIYRLIEVGWIHYANMPRRHSARLRHFPPSTED